MTRMNTSGEKTKKKKYFLNKSSKVNENSILDVSILESFSKNSWN